MGQYIPVRIEILGIDKLIGQKYKAPESVINRRYFQDSISNVIPSSVD